MKYYLIILLSVLYCLSNTDASVIKGRVTDEMSGEALPNANVLLKDTQTGAVADQNGRFIVPGIVPGRYQVQVNHMGYEPYSLALTVSEQDTVNLEIALTRDVFRLSDVVVTASRSPQIYKNVAVPTRVVQRREIEARGALDVADALKTRPGIVIQRGTSGEKNVTLNGIDGKRVLVLVDGVPFSARLNDKVNLAHIDADQVDRIEIVKGPGSALYGSDAMGGVINVITRSVSNETIAANLRYGSYETVGGNFNLSRRLGAVHTRVTLDVQKQGARQSVGEIQVDESQAMRAGLTMDYTNKRLGDFTIKTDLRRDEMDSETQFMGQASDNELDVQTWHSTLDWKREFGTLLQTRIKGYYSGHHREYSTESFMAPAASVDTTEDQIYGVRSDIAWSVTQTLDLDMGVDVSRHNYDNKRLSSKAERDELGVFAQAQWQALEPVRLSVGGRFDKISNLEAHWSPRVSTLIDVSSNLSLRAHWGLGFRAPSFIEMYSDFMMPIPGMPLQVKGNPHLQPETSNGTGLGLDFLVSDRMNISVSAFRNELNDMIVDFQQSSLVYSYHNVEHAVFKGFEVRTAYKIGPLQPAVSYIYTDIEKSQGYTGGRTAPHAGSVELTGAWFKERLTLSVRDQVYSEQDVSVVGRGGAISAQTKEAYHMLDLSLGFSFTSRIELRAGVNNVNDYTNDLYGPYIGREFFTRMQVRY
ncbi:MAG: TonB-dependent receptor [candidate division KSB1 bacterium]|nr:TonB-dependent receptor [candidate division KSB1 bacterium]